MRPEVTPLPTLSKARKAWFNRESPQEEMELLYQSSASP